MSILQGLWIEDTLTSVERLSIRSFLDHGHHVHVYTYAGGLTGLPEGAVCRDANEILPRERIWQYAHGSERGSWGGAANHFRYLLLQKRGGIWTDLDVICLRPFPTGTPYISGQRLVDDQPEPGNQVLHLPPGHPLLAAAIAACEAADPAQLRFGETGPKLIQRLVAEMGLEALVKPPSFANPLPGPVWEEAYLAEYGDWYDRLCTQPEVHGLHLWNEKGRKRGYQKDVWYDPASLFAKLAARHAVELPNTAAAREAGNVLRAQLLSLKAGRRGSALRVEDRLALLTKALEADPVCAPAQRQILSLAEEQPRMIRAWVAARPRPLPRILRQRLPKVLPGIGL